MPVTPRFGIPYPDGPSGVTPLPAWFAGLAVGVENAMITGLGGAPRLARSDSERNTQAPSPSQGDLFWRPDKQWVEAYFEAYNGTTNPLGATPAGWYPLSGFTPQAQFYRLGNITNAASQKVLAGATTRRITPDISLNAAGDIVFTTLGVYEAKVQFEWGTANSAGQRNMAGGGTATSFGSSSFVLAPANIASLGQYGHFHFSVTAPGQTWTPSTSQNSGITLVLRNTVDVNYIGPNQ